MARVIIDNITLTSSSDNTLKLSAWVEASDDFFEPFELWFSCPKKLKGYFLLSGNPFLAALLPLAMVSGYDLDIKGQVSERLYKQTDQIMTIFADWYDHANPVQINIKGLQRDENISAVNVGCFFTGGVDSFYSVLKNLRLYENESRVTHLIYVNGFDVDLENKELFRAVREQIEHVANDFNLETIFISSNLRSLTDKYVRWGKEQHGAALASIALSLAGFLKRVIIPSSCAYSELYPWGSHPILDHLWSTERLQFIHDGNEAKRTQKVLWELSKSKVALDHLRVCWRNFDNKYNCGVCGKCIRTKINLKIAGVLEQCKTLDNDLYLDRYQSILIDNFTERRNLRENLNLAESIDPKLKETFQDLLDTVDYKRSGFSFKFINFLSKFSI